MDDKKGNPSDQLPMDYQGQAPPAYPVQQPPVTGQQPPGYPQQQGYPVQQQQPGYPGQPGYPVQQQPGYVGYPGQVVVTMPPAQKMNNNLILAIIATLCCCPLCGIIGIVYAAQVDSKFFRGDVAGAQDYANNAKRWSIAAIICGIAWVVIVVVYYIVMITTYTQMY